MLSRILSVFFIALFAFTAFVHANGPIIITSTTVTSSPPTTTSLPIPPNACTADVGTLLCCNSLGSASAAPIGLLLGLFGIALSTISALVGVNCTPLQLLPGGGSTCDAQPVCCAANNWNGVVAIGCVPVNVNL